MQKLLTVFCLALCLSAASVAAQNSASRFFQPASEQEIALRGGAERVLIPEVYTTYRFDLQAFRQSLASAPLEFTAAARAGKTRVAMPLPDGSFEEFSVWQTEMMEPELAARYPEIRTYAGQSLREPGKILRMTTCPQWMRAKMLTPDAGAHIVQCIAANGGSEFYMAYDRQDIPASARLNLPGAVQMTDAQSIEKEELFAPGDPEASQRGPLIEAVNLKVYRFAVTTTGEFGQDNGGTVASVLAKVVDVTNQVSGVFERDIQMRLQLINFEDHLIFTDPNSDPFFGTEVFAFMGQNGGVINQIVGAGSYDVGHNYCRYLGGSAAGVAGGITCTSGKASGCSSGGGDYGDGFENVVGQEVGHQMSGGHTWNRCGDVGGRAGDTAFEPGSGSTIMSYAGSCGTDNVQSYSDLYYHSGSIEEIKRFYTTGSGALCGSTKATTNNYPEVALPYPSGLVIPISTPFELNGSATDPDGDALTYNWEQMDAGAETPLEAPAGKCPLFRTRPSVTATNRYFPRLTTVLFNSFDITEQLPTYTRDLTFRLTARDNRADGGGSAWQDVEFKSTALAGPFLVKYPNTNADILRVGEYAHITWDVANTDKAPVNCKTVNIRLSTNGGQTYPITLAAGVANDGSQYVLVPNNVTTVARIRVDAADNVFYDISNANFKIQAPVEPTVSVGLSADGGQICLPATFSSEIFTAGILGFNAPVSLDVTGLPAGATANFATATLTPGQSTSLTLDLTKVTTEGTYTMEVLAFGPGMDTVRRPITLTTVSNDFSALALVAPADGSTGLGRSQILRWQKSPDANTYDLQFGTDPKFNSLLYAPTGLTVDTFKIGAQLDKSKAYYWRVRPSNECGLHDWTEAFFFSTLVDKCFVVPSQELPKSLTPNGTPSFEAKIHMNIPGTVSVLNVKQLKGYHESFKDLDVRLSSPSGTEVTLFKNKCGSINSTFNFGMADDAPNNFQCPPSNVGVNVRPQTPLGAFAGEDVTGAWTLKVKDQNLGGGGELIAMQLEFCASVTLNPPYLVNNNVLTLAPGTNAAIDPALLLVEDADNTHPQLTYTLLSVPQKGRLEFANVPLAAGDTLTQADIDNGALRYFDYGLNAGDDHFRFIVHDGTGGWLGSTEFTIQPFPVGTSEAAAAARFALFPNPTADAATLAFEQPLRSATRVAVFNASGQLLRSAAMNIGSDRLRLSLAGLPSGVYTVSVQNGEGVAARRLVLRGE